MERLPPERRATGWRIGEGNVLECRFWTVGSGLTSEQATIRPEFRLLIPTGRFLNLSSKPNASKWRAGATSFLRVQTSVLEILWNFWAAAIVYR